MLLIYQLHHQSSCAFIAGGSEHTEVQNISLNHVASVKVQAALGRMCKNDMYYLFDDERIKINPIFKERELERFYELWDKGMDYRKIARKMNRNNMDIVLLILDRGEVGAIKNRRTGIFGN